jgi:hypothetical protein
LDKNKAESKFLDRVHYDGSQKLLSFLNDFIDRDSTMTNNNETIKVSSNVLKNELIVFLKNNDSIFYQYPIKLSKIVNMDGEYYGKFVGVNSFNYRDIQNEATKKPISKGSNKIESISYVLLLKLQKDEITTLKEDSYYKMVGKFNSLLGGCIFKNFHQNGEDCNPYIEKGIISRYLIRFDLGFMYFEPTSKLELTDPKVEGVDFTSY